MNGRVAGQVAIVFGGGQTPGQTVGNGRATAMVLAREGAHVIVVDRKLQLAQETADLIQKAGGKAQAMQCDATHEDQVQSIITKVQGELGHIDILHNNIGASIELGDQTADVLTEEAFDRSFAVNLKSSWMSIKHVLPIFRKQNKGSIVNISSLAAAQAYPLLGYKTMKAAVIAMTENVAAANAQYGIRVNAILPGLMNTPMAIESRVGQGRAREEVIAARDRRIPLGKKWELAGTLPTPLYFCTRMRHHSSQVLRLLLTAVNVSCMVCNFFIDGVAD